MDAGSAAAWDAHAGDFDQQPDHGLTDPAVRDAWRSLLRSLLPPTPATVVDLGCGTGSLACLLAGDGFDVEGVDFSETMLDRARAKADAAGVTVRFRLGDAADPPVEGPYDVVLARHVLWALPEPEVALGRWVSLLRPGGRLVLVEGRWDTGAGLPGTWTEAAVRSLTVKVLLRVLDDPALWGGPITDERYVVVGERAGA